MAAALRPLYPGTTAAWLAGVPALCQAAGCGHPHGFRGPMYPPNGQTQARGIGCIYGKECPAGDGHDFVAHDLEGAR